MTLLQLHRFYSAMRQPWRCRLHGPAKRWYDATTLHSATTQKTTNSQGRISVNCKLERLWKEVFMAYSKTLYQNFPVVTEEKHTPQDSRFPDIQCGNKTHTEY